MAVELFRIPIPKSTDVFDVGWATWDALLDVGRSFGWEPQGTVLIEPNPPDPEYKAKLEASLMEAQRKLDALEAIPDPPYEVQVQMTLTRGWIDRRLNPYAPVLWGDLGMRRVTPEDAVALAEALNRALQHLHRLGRDLSYRELIQLGEPIEDPRYHHSSWDSSWGLGRGFLEVFISFLRRGGFGISVWD